MRTIIVDDSESYRGLLRGLLGQIKGIEITGEFPSGQALIARVQQLAPELIVLDIEMPEMDGLKTLMFLAQMKIEASVLIVSGHASADKTVRALSLGALDVILKPMADDAGHSGLLASLKRGIGVARARSRRSAGAESHAAVPVSAAPLPVDRDNSQGMVVIGVSTGGPQALETVVAGLDASFKLPILIVQHMPIGFTRSLAASLAKRCKLGVSEATPGALIRPGHILIAPGGHHLEVARSAADGLITRQTDGAPVNGCRPAVDSLFQSVAQHFDGQVLAVVMTGMGHDGRNGMRALRERRAHCIAQDEKTSVVYGMPRSVVEAGLADEILPLEQIGPRIQAFGDAVQRA